MRNVYEVLREKENAIERLRREVKALRSATSLLARKEDLVSNIPAPQADCWEVRTETVSQPGDALGTVVPFVTDAMDDALAKIRARLVEAAENETKLAKTSTISRHLRQITAPLLGAKRR